MPSGLATDEASHSAIAARIGLGTSVDIDGSGASFHDGVLTISAAGTYVLTGVLQGQVLVNAPVALVELILDGVSVHNPDGPAMLVLAANGVVVDLTAGSENRLEDGGTSEFDAALYSEAPVTIAGSGSLDIYASYEGISSTTHITVRGGTIHVYAGEDALNASRDGVSRIDVTGGYVYAYGETGDGIDSNGTLSISAGTVIAWSGFASGESGLDADGGIYITGGTVMANGSRGPIPLRTAGQQKALVLDYDVVQDREDLVVVLGEDGEVLVAFEVPTRFRRFVFSSEKVVDGKCYGVSYGGTPVGQAIDGIYEGVQEVGELVARARPGYLVMVRTPADPLNRGTVRPPRESVRGMCPAFRTRCTCAAR